MRFDEWDGDPRALSSATEKVLERLKRRRTDLSVMTSSRKPSVARDAEIFILDRIIREIEEEKQHESIGV